MQCNARQWNGMEQNTTEWNGMEQNRIQWNGMEQNRKDWNGTDTVEWIGIAHKHSYPVTAVTYSSR